MFEDQSNLLIAFALHLASRLLLSGCGLVEVVCPLVGEHVADAEDLHEASVWLDSYSFATVI